jgi:hypothetical protein
MSPLFQQLTDSMARSQNKKDNGKSNKLILNIINIKFKNENFLSIKSSV